MRAMGWLSLTAAVALASGCASQHAANDGSPPDKDFPGFRMTSSTSSDTSGADAVDRQIPVEANMPVPLTLDQLPPAAQTTVRREAGARRVVKIKRETRDNEVFYKVELTRDGSWFHGIVVVTPDGTLIRESHVAP